MEQNGVTQAVATILKQEEVPEEEDQAADEEEEDQEPKENAEDENDTSQSPSGGRQKRSAASAAVMTQFDSADDFNAVFGDKREFDSWDEYTDLLEEFQTRSGTRYKARSACRVDHVNERRIGSQIPERFVYAAIKMICVHYGEGGSGKRKNYVGKGCEAYMRVSYSRGAMRITQTHLLHTNHDRSFEEDNPHTRNFRVFNFTEDLDNLLVTEVLRANPYEFKNGEKEWSMAVDRLKDSDPQFAQLTPRVVKKRTRLLLDNFSAISQGRRPPDEDEMGTMLFELQQAKDHINEAVPSIPKPRKRKMRGRPRKVPVSDEEMGHVEDVDEDDLVAYTPAKKAKGRKTAIPSFGSPSKTSAASSSGDDITMVLSFLQKKDEEDRKLQHKEREEDRRQRLKDAEEDRKLRQREIDLRREELAFQKERFELEKTERQVHMDLLKSQLQVFEQSMLMKQPVQQPLQQVQVQTASGPTPQQTILTLAQPLPSQPQPALQQPPPAQPQPTHQYHYQT